MDLIVSTHMVAQTEKDKDMADIEKKRVECVSRAYLSGLATFPIVFGGLFITQRTFAKKLLSPLILLSSSAIFAGTGTYMLVSNKLIECQKSALQEADAKNRAIRA